MQSNISKVTATSSLHYGATIYYSQQNVKVREEFVKKFGKQWTSIKFNEMRHIARGKVNSF